MSNHLTETITYDIAGNFTFDSSLIEVTGGVARPKDITPASATFQARYGSSIDGDWGDGTLTGTAAGGAAVSSGKLDLVGAGKYVDYDANLNADSQQTLTVSAKVTPNYSGNPSASAYFFSIAQANNNINNLVSVYHAASGVIGIVVYSGTGTQIIDTNLGSWSPTASTEYVIELDMDITTGATRFFIDGTQQGTTQTDTGTRSSSIGLLRVGAYYTGTGSYDGQIDDVTIFSTVQNTTTYTPADTEKYSTANPDILRNASFETDGILTFTENASKAGSDEIKYTVLVDNVDKYWNTSAWANSDGTYAQANTAAEINTNAASLDISAGVDVKIRAFLHSDNSLTRPSLTSVAVGYNFFAAQVAPNICTVYFFADDVVGTGISDLKVYVKPTSDYADGDTLVLDTNKSFTADSAGYVEMELYETASESKSMDFTLSYRVGSREYLKHFNKRIIPNEPSKQFSSLTIAT